MPILRDKIYKHRNVQLHMFPFWVFSVFSRGVEPSGGTDPVRGQFSQLEITALEQRVTTMERGLQAAHSQTTIREHVAAEAGTS